MPRAGRGIQVGGAALLPWSASSLATSSPRLEEAVIQSQGGHHHGVHGWGGIAAVHVAVAAASIVAKVRRDRLFSELLARIRREYRERFGEEFGPIHGSGYPNEATEEFLRGHHRRTGALPAGIRHAWNWSVIRELSPRRSLFQ